MTHIELLEKHAAHSDFIAFAGAHPDLAAMVAASDSIVFLGWVLQLIANPRERVGITAHIVRHTPIGDGRTVYNLLTDDRSRHALDVCDRYAIGDATDEELAAAAATAATASGAAAAFASYAADYTATAVYYATAAAKITNATAAAARAAAAAFEDFASYRAANKWQSAYIKSLDWATLTGETL